jgi:hypothetical protein
MNHPRSTLSASLALAFLPSLAAAQAPPCLGPFQRVASTSSVPLNARMLNVTVQGANALASITGSSSQGYVDIIEAFRELAPGGPWVATQAWPLDGARGRIALDGERAAILRNAPGSPYEVVVYERQVATGLWLQTFALPSPTYFDPRLSGDMLVLPSPNNERVEIWRREASGIFTLEATIESPDVAVQDFGFQTDVAGDRLAVTHAGYVYIYRRNGAGDWPLELRVHREPEFRLDWIAEPQIDDGRLVHVVRPEAVNGKGLAFWRLVEGPSGANALFDGVVWESALSSEFTWLLGPVSAASTAIQRLRDPGCGSLDPAWTPLAVVGAGAGDRPIVDGHICQLGGFAGAGNGEQYSYDGRTLAVAVPEEVGAPRNNVHFATLLGADLDGDRNCVEDSLEIAATPNLDRNGNTRLDSTEERGDDFCLPLAPNSVGMFATLRVIGTEVRFSNDLMAVARGLPPGTFGVVAVALAPVPLPAQAMGPFGVCLSGSVGRYSAVQAGTDGVATTAVPFAAVPTPNGPINAYLNETWSWQLVYRDGSVPGATSAVAVTVR